MVSSDFDQSQTGRIMNHKDQGFTAEQFQKLLNLIDKQETPENVANMSGTINCFLASIKTNFWIVDTGASNHMVSNLDLMSSSQALPLSAHNQVLLPNGNIAQISHKGTCTLDKDQTLQDVLHIPMFKYNLLSVSKLTKDLQCFATFYPDFFLFQDLYTGKVKGIGKVKDGLYILSTKSPTSAISHTCFSTQSANVKSSIWHQRLGHAPIPILNQINAIQPTLDISQICNCHICPLARQTRKPFPTHIVVSTHVFQLVHMDVWGPFKQETYNGNKYFLTLVDDFCRMTWVFLLKFKSDCLLHLKNFILLVKNQFDITIKIIRSDNGLEFINTQCTALFNFLGIVHQRTCVYTPQQNGVTERKHRHLLEVARALDFKVTSPLNFGVIVYLQLLILSIDFLLEYYMVFHPMKNYIKQLLV